MNRLDPIVEPEALLLGDRNIEETTDYTEQVLRFASHAPSEYVVGLEGSLLKPRVVNLGTDSPNQKDTETVACYTL